VEAAYKNGSPHREHEDFGDAWGAEDGCGGDVGKAQETTFYHNQSAAVQPLPRASAAGREGGKAKV